MIRGLLALAALAAVTGAAQAGGYDRYEARSIPVAAADLDLATSAGIAELYRRVDRAVDRICDDDRDCRIEAWESTEAQASSAIAHDRWIRRLARERAAQLRACGRHGCGAPAYYRPPYQPAPSPTVVHASGGTTVTVVVQTSGPVYYRR